MRFLIEMIVEVGMLAGTHRERNNKRNETYV